MRHFWPYWPHSKVFVFIKTIPINQQVLGSLMNIVVNSSKVTCHWDIRFIVVQIPYASAVCKSLLIICQELRSCLFGRSALELPICGLVVTKSPFSCLTLLDLSHTTTVHFTQPGCLACLTSVLRSISTPDRRCFIYKGGEKNWI